MPLLLGLDVGTQGARVIVCSESGAVVAQSSRPFGGDAAVAGLQPGWFEQRPEAWWEAAACALRDVADSLKALGRDSAEIRAIAVDSTSGTVLSVDSAGEALRPALMYNDGRAEEEAQKCNNAASDLISRLGYRFGSSFGLPKVLWLARREPDTWRRTHRVIHASDYIVGRLTGDFSKSDSSNAMKTGYDLACSRWPTFISDSLGIEIDKLPEVVAPGEPIGCVSHGCAIETGLAPGTMVVGGVSDGTAGFVASGAASPGEWNSTVGTTLVMRGVSESLVKDEAGRVYCHRHPDGFWLPGGASNVGGECLAKLFPGEDYDELSRQIADRLPSGLLVYPLVRLGERLPFIDPHARGFVAGVHHGRRQLYAGYLEGVAFVERWCCELMGELGAVVGDTIYATGGGARSLEWMRIRASVLNKRLVRPAVAESAMGAAMVAASRTVFSSLSEASRAMVKYDARIDPDNRLVEAYDEHYLAFREECASRGLGGKT